MEEELKTLKDVVDSLYSYDDWKKLAKKKNIKLPNGYKWKKN